MRKSKYFVAVSDRKKEKTNERKMPFKFKKRGLRRESPKDLILRAIEEVKFATVPKTRFYKGFFAQIYNLTNFH
ncbi:hypothetical protein GWI33_007275 [Rhynchophorus ferrugineus]|uniref:Uncharacterized protein n=1 Tax=Rhynchophorus ferrugineus TaxID=354439 RepID=A0A834IHV7_RHYFE|nr:hypothetical protein GWI33_007275 [Rhynchophorus ferrugineus]